MNESEDLLTQALQCLEQGDPKAAEPLVQQALNQGIQGRQAGQLLGAIGERVGRPQLAARGLAQALSVDPDDSDLKLRFGRALNQLGQGREAEAALREVVANQPDRMEARLELARSLQIQRRPADAVAEVESLLEEKPEATIAWQMLAALEEQRGAFDRAQRCLKRIVEIEPNEAGGWDRLARLLYFNGQLAACETACRRAIALDPNRASAHRHLGLVRRCSGRDDPDLAAALAVAERTDLDEVARIEIHFALARSFDQIEDWETAFDHARRANETHHRRLRFDLDRYRQENDQIIGRTQSHGAERPLDGPLFIVGMPRSGTTLLEQMLARHGDVETAGERIGMEQWAPVHRGLQQGLCADDARRQYLQTLPSLADHRYVIDKLPQNFRNLDAIAALFPGAAILHLRRNPLAVCRSNYFAYYRSGNFWANDITTLIGYHAEYRRLMAHWRDARILPLLELDYEDLVRDPRQTLDEVLSFLGLPWEEDCLSPESGGRTVTTASAGQVREGIHTRAIDRAAAYDRFFPGLAD